MIVQFSGGKDSLTVLHLYKDYPDVKAYFADTGSVYPHVLEFIHKTCEDFGVPLTVIHSPMPVDEYTKLSGLPSDLVPTNRSPEFSLPMKREGKQKIQSFVQCCGNMLWLPMMGAIKNGDDKTVVRGTKKSDRHATVEPGHIDENGITYYLPIYDWTDKDVFDYLEKNNVELPKHYKDVNASFDCWNCTAHLTEPNAAERLEWTRENYPEFWPALEERFEAVRDAVLEEQAIIDNALGVLNEQYK